MNLFVSFIEQKSIIWGHCWKHQLQRRCTKFSNEKCWSLSLGTLEPSIRDCNAPFSFSDISHSPGCFLWRLNLGILVLDLLNQPFVTTCSLIFIDRNPFLMELCGWLSPTPACGDNGRFQAAFCFGLCLWYVERCNWGFLVMKGNALTGLLSLNMGMLSGWNHYKVVFVGYWQNPCQCMAWPCGFKLPKLRWHLELKQGCTQIHISKTWT